MYNVAIYRRYAYQSPNHRPPWSFVLTIFIGPQGKSKRRRRLCYAGRKSPSHQLDDFEIVMLISSFIQTRRPVTPASLLLSFSKRAGLNPVVFGVFTAIMKSAETLRTRSGELIIALNTPKALGLSPAPFNMTKAKTPE